MRFRQLAVLTLIVTGAAACGGSSGNGTEPPTPPVTPPTTPPTTPPAASNEITIGNDSFTPSSMTVPVNTTVTWTWDTCGSGAYGTTGCVAHNVTFDDGTASATQDTGTFTRTFATAGTYQYHCTIHGAAVMSGKIIVQ